MKPLIIAGLGVAPGKTTLAAGLAQTLLERGKQLAYIKVSDVDDGDADFLAAALSLASKRLSATRITSDAILADDAGKDIALVEVSGSVEQATGVAAALKGALLYVIGYPAELDAATAVALAASQQGRWTGVVVNGVPSGPIAANKVAAELAGLPEGVVAVGQLPESRALLGFCVGDLADHLQATYLGGAQLKDGLIESLIVGANAADPTDDFFAPRSGAAVFCRIDRPDIQLGALNHPVRCLVLTGEGHPQAFIINLAEDAGVAVLQVPKPTIPVLEQLNGLPERVRFHQQAKLPVAAGMVNEALDLSSLTAALDAT